MLGSKWNTLVSCGSDQFRGRLYEPERCPSVRKSFCLRRLDPENNEQFSRYDSLNKSPYIFLFTQNVTHSCSHGIYLIAISLHPFLAYLLQSEQNIKKKSIAKTDLK